MLAEHLRLPDMEERDAFRAFLCVRAKKAKETCNARKCKMESEELSRNRIYLYAPLRAT